MGKHLRGRTSGTMLRTDVPETIETMYFGQEEIMQMVPMGTAFLTCTVFIKVNIPFRKYFQSLLYQFAFFFTSEVKLLHQVDKEIIVEKGNKSQSQKFLLYC